MDREELINQLPESLAVALRLSDAGHPDQTIACALGLPVQSVSVILRVATAKLAKLEEDVPGRGVRAIPREGDDRTWVPHWRRLPARATLAS